MLLAFVLCFGCVQAQTPAPSSVPATSRPDWVVQRLMQHRALEQHSEVTFTERRYLAILDAPLELSGKLIYEAPAHLAKHTLKPVPESFIIQGDQVRIEKPGKPARELAIDDHPLLYALAISLRATLAGDLATLETWYVIDFSGTREDWRLQLTPRQQNWRAHLRDIVIRGRQEALSEITLHEQSGDHSVMLISPNSAQEDK